MTCQFCGCVPENDALAWGSSTERGQVQYLCPDCARDHLRDIEGKIDLVG